MVKPRKFAEIFNGCLIVGARSIFFCNENSEIDIASVYADATHEFFGSTMPTYSLETRLVVLVITLVSDILTASTWAKILSAVIKCVSIRVIYLAMMLAKQLAVYQKASIYARLFPDCIVVRNILGPHRSPIPLIQPFVVDSIYDCILSACKGNQFDRLVLRLDDSVTLHVALHKEPRIPCAVVRPLCIV